MGAACTWCVNANNTAAPGYCTTEFCQAPFTQSYYSAVCAPPSGCELITDCATCVATPGCSQCAISGLYSFCVNGTNACTHNDAVTTAAQCASVKPVSNSISVCETLSCNQCLNNEFGLFCNWCGASYANGQCSTLPCTDNSTWTNGTLCPTPTANACETKNCGQCIGSAGCSFCGSASSMYGQFFFSYTPPYGFCVNGTNACNSNDTVNSLAQCSAVNAGDTTVCNALSCNQCLNNNMGLFCSWCGSPSGGQCVSTFSCPATEPTLTNSSLCAAPNACENLSCDQCIANPQCSMCAQSGFFGYEFCVLGAGACVHNDSVTTPAQCAALRASTATICESLNCGQCLGVQPNGLSLGCHWCGGYNNGSCSTQSCLVPTSEQFDATQCPAPLANACSTLACDTCALASSRCSSCGATGRYQLCVDGVNACPSGEAEPSVQQCVQDHKSLLTVCDTLSCNQCLNVTSSSYNALGCNLCTSSSSSSTAGVCQTAPCANYTASYYAQCGATNVCESLNCTSCIANSACSYCASAGFYGFCVLGAGACVSNDTVSDAATCASLLTPVTPPATTICESLSCHECIDDSGARGLNCLWCDDGYNPGCTSQPFCPGTAVSVTDSTMCPISPCDGLSCNACLLNSQCSYCGKPAGNGTNGYGFCVPGANACSHGDTVANVAQCNQLALDPCPLLSCNQCTKEQALETQFAGCNLCVGRGEVRCTAGLCPGGFALQTSKTTCSSTPCESLACADCVQNPSCSMCADNAQGFSFCVNGANKCANATISTLAQCLTITDSGSGLTAAPTPRAATTPTTATALGGTTSSNAQPTQLSSAPATVVTAGTTNGGAALSCALLAALVALLAPLVARN